MGINAGGMSGGIPVVTIITPVYNEQESLPLYEKAVREVLLSRTDYKFRVLFIDDGSSDESWKEIEGICRRDPAFRGVRLSRNYGSHIALSAGFAHAGGDAVAVLACDLQDPPEVIIEFLGRWRSGAHIVWGRRRERRDEKWRVLASALFHRLLKRFAMPRGSKFQTGSFFLADGKVAECFRQFGEQNRITFALVAWTGFEQAVVDYSRAGRVAGRSGWTFFKMIKAMYDAFIGFSLLPVRLMTAIGALSFLLTLLLSAYVITAKIAERPVPGWTGIMLTLSVFFGIQFLLMGISGEYLYRIYAEVVRRPLYFVSETTDSPDASR